MSRVKYRTHEEADKAYRDGKISRWTRDRVYDRIDNNGRYKKHLWRDKMQRQAKKVWKKYYGEKPKGYEIHHIDEDPTNNHPGNLMLLPSEVHRDAHKSLEELRLAKLDRVHWLLGRIKHEEIYPYFDIDPYRANVMLAQIEWRDKHAEDFPINIDFFTKDTGYSDLKELGVIK